VAEPVREMEMQYLKGLWRLKTLKNVKYS